MRGVNKVILVATLGNDPESKSFQNGGSVCNFSVATSESWIDKNTGEKKQVTEWHRITANGKLGENAQKYLKKGSKVYLEGSLRTRKWVDQSGQEKFATEVCLDSMQMLDSRPQGQQQAPQQQQGGYAQQPKPQGYAPQAQNNFDDDIPF